jgi:hypothetical protein
MRVEALLREWEYHSDLLAAAGKPTIDVAVLRAELGLQSDLDDVDDLTTADDETEASDPGGGNDRAVGDGMEDASNGPAA